MIGWWARYPFLKQRIWGNKKKMDHQQRSLFKRDRSIRFVNPDKFARFAANIWNHLYVFNQYPMQGRQLAWRSFKDKKQASEHMYSAAYHYYEDLKDDDYSLRLIQDREPLILTHGRRFAFTHRGHTMRVTYDEIRKGMVVRKNVLKTGIIMKELHEDERWTMRSLGMSIASQNYVLRELFELTEEFAESQVNEVQLSSYINLQVHELVTGRIIPTYRDNGSLDELMFAIDNMLRIAEGDEFIPNHKNCYMCGYNVLDKDDNIPCEVRNKKYRPNEVL